MLSERKKDERISLTEEQPGKEITRALFHTNAGAVCVLAYGLVLIFTDGVTGHGHKEGGDLVVRGKVKKFLQDN